MEYSTIVGSVGVAITLLAYFLNIAKLIRVNGKLFSVMNIFGAGIACYGSLLIDYWPFVVLEGTWTLISVYALMRAMRIKVS